MKGLIQQFKKGIVSVCALGIFVVFSPAAIADSSDSSASLNPNTKGWDWGGGYDPGASASTKGWDWGGGYGPGVSADTQGWDWGGGYDPGASADTQGWDWGGGYGPGVSADTQGWDWGGGYGPSADAEGWDWGGGYGPSADAEGWDWGGGYGPSADAEGWDWGGGYGPSADTQGWDWGGGYGPSADTQGWDWGGGYGPLYTFAKVGAEASGAEPFKGTLLFAGPVSSIDYTENTIALMGKTFILESEQLAALAAGSYIGLVGEMSADGTISIEAVGEYSETYIVGYSLVAASHIEPPSRKDRWSAMVLGKEAKSTLVTVFGTEISYSSGEIEASYEVATTLGGG